MQVEEITTNAGVRKEFDAFSKMIFSALVGSNTSVSFFVENCAEMERRIRERRVGSTLSTTARMKMDESADGTKKEGHRDDRDNSSADEDEGALDDDEENDDEASIRRRFFHQQLFFSLDYDVDFTRALFPIPLSHSSSATLKSGRSLTTTLREPQSLLPSSSSAAAKGSGEDDGYRAKYVEASRDKKKLELEVKRLKKENDALTKLCNERMTEMQRLCDDLQVKIGSEAETRRLKKDLAEAQRRVQQLESLNDSLRREVKAAAASGVNSRSSPLRRPSPSRLVGPATQPQSVRQRRFDTPPHNATSSSRAAPLHGAPRDSSRQSSRASTPPRSPRPAWGQRAPPQPTNRSLHSSYDSLTSDNGPSKPQRRFDSPRKGPMVSPRSAHQRLYMTDTASSSGLRHKYDRDRLLLS